MSLEVKYVQCGEAEKRSTTIKDMAKHAVVEMLSGDHKGKTVVLLEDGKTHDAVWVVDMKDLDFGGIKHGADNDRRCRLIGHLQPLVVELVD